MIALNSDLEKRRQQSIDRCDTQIDYLQGTIKKTEIVNYILLYSTIVLGGLTPVLILWSDLPKPIQALPSALAAMTAALDKALRPRDNMARMSYFNELLKGEKHKFETRTTKDYNQKLDDYEALNTFVEKVDSLMKSEITEWRALSQEKNQT